MKIDKYIEVVSASKARLNAMGKKAREAVVATLQEKYTRVEVTIVDTMQDLVDLVDKKPDLVVLGMKAILLQPELGYDVSPKLWLSDFLTEHGINFTGSETDALRLEYNKQTTKQHVMDAGLQSAAYFISTVHNPIVSHTLAFPLFVKLANSGGSKGIDENSLVYTQEALEAKITSIHETHDSSALVEEYLSGREFSVGVVDNVATGELRALPIEILPPTDSNGHTFLSAAIKKADSEKVSVVPDGVVKTAISDFAIDVFKSIGARDYGRIDIRLDADGTPNFIEANLMPGLSQHGYMSRCFAMNEQVDYSGMIHTIVDLGFERAELFT